MRMQRIAENYHVSLPLAVVMMFFPILNWFGLTWAVFAVLRHNIYVGMLSVLLVGLAGIFVLNGLRFYGTMGEWFSILVFIVPLWAMAYSLRVFRSLQISLQLGFLLIALVAILHFGVFGPISYDDLYKYLSNRLFAGQSAQEGLGQTLQQLYLRTMVSTAIFAWPTMLFIMQVMALLCARYFQSRWYYQGGFQSEFHALRLSRFMAAPLLLSFLWIITAPQSQIAVQIAGLATLLYSIAGLAFLHWYINERKLGTVWLVLIYVAMFVLSAWAVLILAVIALVDSYLDLRTRLKR